MSVQIGYVCMNLLSSEIGCSWFVNAVSWLVALCCVCVMAAGRCETEATGINNLIELPSRRGCFWRTLASLSLHQICCSRFHSDAVRYYTALQSIVARRSSRAVAADNNANEQYAFILYCDSYPANPSLQI